MPYQLKKTVSLKVGTAIGIECWGRNLSQKKKCFFFKHGGMYIEKNSKMRFQNIPILQNTANIFASWICKHYRKMQMHVTQKNYEGKSLIFFQKNNGFEQGEPERYIIIHWLQNTFVKYLTDNLVYAKLQCRTNCLGVFLRPIHS